MTRGGEKGPYALACTPRAGSMYLLHAGDGVQATAAKRIESVQAATDQVHRLEHSPVPNRDIDHAMVSEVGEGAEDGRFLNKHGICWGQKRSERAGKFCRKRHIFEALLMYLASTLRAIRHKYSIRLHQ